MRVIFQTQPVAGRFVDPRSGRQLAGYAHFEVIQFDPDEDLPAYTDQAVMRAVTHRLSALRAREGVGKPIKGRLHPGSPLRALLPAEVVVPEAVLADLPAESQIQMFFHFTPTGEAS
jgi:hypothetical protein